MGEKKRTRRKPAQIRLDKLLELKKLGIEVKEGQLAFARQAVWAEEGAICRVMCSKCKSTLLLHVPSKAECCGKQMKTTWTNPFVGV